MKKENTETRGRKGITDKKVPIHILPRKSEIDALGGKAEVRKLCEDYISKCVAVINIDPNNPKTWVEK